MKPTDFRCFDQVAKVIGKKEAEVELQKVLDCKECQGQGEPLLEEKLISRSFSWRFSPQGYAFWSNIHFNETDSELKKPLSSEDWGKYCNGVLFMKELGFKLGDKVVCDLAGVSVTGIIRGNATVDIVKVFIVECTDETLPTDDYSFTHFVCPASLIKLQEEEISYVLFEQDYHTGDLTQRSCTMSKEEVKKYSSFNNPDTYVFRLINKGDL